MPMTTQTMPNRHPQASRSPRLPLRMQRSCRIACQTVLTTLFLLLAALQIQGAPAPDPRFPTPDNLVDNVAFWKKIYTEVSLTQGLLHDREFPRIVYDTVTTGQLSGTPRIEKIRSHKDPFVQALNTINTTPPETWGEREKKIYAQFKAAGAVQSLAGAVDRIRFQQGQKERYLEGLIRSGIWLDTIRTILTQYEVPLILAYLPHVESSFDYDAYSKVGAAGLWQFMPATGKSYMTIDYLVDERRDPIRATVAAAKLLTHNYSQLQAWPLAITAYNHGLSGIKRAVNATGSRDIGVIIERHQSPSFQFASKNFYGCFLAASEIAADPEPYFGVIPYKKPFQAQILKLDRYVHPQTISSQMGIPLLVLQKLNPALRPVVFTQHKQIPAGFELNVPSELSLADIRRQFAALPDTLVTKEPDRPAYYRVRRGDNLYDIAVRLGTTARELAAVNNITSLNRIYEGQVLHMPVSGLAPAPVVQMAASEPVAHQEPEEEMDLPATAIIPQKPLAPPPTAPTAPAAPTPVTSPQRDTLVELATIVADSLPRSSARVNPGLLARFNASVYNFEVNHSLAPRLAEIRISVDETIGHYAEWLKVPSHRIHQLNRLHSRSTIRVGSTLIIPADTPDAIELFIKNRLEYHMGLEEDFYSQYKVADLKSHTIKRGQTLWDICNSADGTIPLWLFYKHNIGIDLSKLAPGTTVQIPVIEEKTPADLALESLEHRGTLPYAPLHSGNRAGFVLLP